MTSAKGWILLSHSHQDYPAVGEAELLDALPTELRDGPRERVRIAGTVPVGDDAADVDWAALQREQVAQVSATGIIELRKERGIAYFGRTLLPLAMDLGYRLEGWAAKSQVFLYHTRTKSWRWPPRAPGESSMIVQMRHNLPVAPISISGDVVIRVAVSQSIAPEDTRAVVPAPLAEVDVCLDGGPGRDALATLDDLERVVTKFDEALSKVKESFPRSECIHLFAAVPAGLAFRIGNIVNHKVHPPIVAYQFVRRAPVRYQRAFVLGADPVVKPGRSARVPVDPVVKPGRRARMKVKILFLAAAPRAEAELRVTHELTQIRNELRDSAHRERFEALLEPRLAVHKGEVQKYLRRDRPNIIHFSGHGNASGRLLLEGEGGGSDFLTPEALKEYLRVANKKEHIRCVVLNACFSHVAAELLVTAPRVVPCAIGTTKAVGDPYAIAFARAFYSALADGESLGDAFEAGQAEVYSRAPEQAACFQLFVADEALRNETIFSL